MKRSLIILSGLLIAGYAAAQETSRDTLRTEEITVVKPYTPTISTAFKIGLTPEIGTDTIRKERVSYSIFSFPVASTFTPAKGRAQRLERGPKERLYENYVSAGFGNFTSPLFEAYLHAGDPRHDDFGLFINHHSSKGGVEDVLLDDQFSSTRIDGYYGQFDRDYAWQLNAGVQRELINYYGIPRETIFDPDVIEALNEQQIYKIFYLGGKITMEESVFQGATSEMVSFSDDYGTSEFRLLTKPRFEFPISTELIGADLMVDFLSGKFDQTYLTDSDLKYSYLNLGVSPSFTVLRENLSVHLGATLVYANDLERKTNEFYAYPNVDASFKVIDDIFILVAGVTGELTQHTYKDLSGKNPFVSPTLDIQPTDQQYKAFAGIKGKLASNIGYNLQLSHTDERNKPMFIHNPIMTDGTMLVEKSFQAGNSFGLVYDDVKTLGLFGELSIDASKEFSFSGSMQYNKYSPNTEVEAWNLPQVTAVIKANYSNDSWFAGAKLYYHGPTDDLFIPYGLTSEQGLLVENDSYMDLNLHGGYMFSDRLTAFGRINNALGKKYDRYLNYRVQALQILGGITYKFDF
jgi:outer membrane receptor protein involved in Fe transport